ncbi:hypothetical protein FOZ62_020722 [Perkinsus olseni]|uniref:START domain-containing protein n=1 Tax=Perkinsus olseni TaxID=32597 RepID=A0A7J6TGM2_PEROL|nr:hypothetical protein FOZ62_020722 [Perkinsus olseni]
MITKHQQQQQQQQQQQKQQQYLMIPSQQTYQVLPVLPLAGAAAAAGEVCHQYYIVHVVVEKSLGELVVPQQHDDEDDELPSSSSSEGGGNGEGLMPSSINRISRSLSNKSATPYFSSSWSTIGTDSYGDDCDYTTCYGQQPHQVEEMADDDDSTRESPYDTCQEDDDEDNSTRESPYDTCQEDDDDDNNESTATPPAAAAAPVTVSVPPSPLDHDDFLSSTYKKAVEYCRPLVTSSSSSTTTSDDDDDHDDDDDLTTPKGCWIPQPVDNVFDSKRNLKANVRELDDGGKLCRLDCDFPEYTVKQVYNVLYDKREQKEWNRLVESVEFIDDDITMPALPKTNKYCFEYPYAAFKYDHAHASPRAVLTGDHGEEEEDVIGSHLMNDIMEGVRARTVNYSNGIFGITWSLNTHDALQRIDHLTSHRFAHDALHKLDLVNRARAGCSVEVTFYHDFPIRRFQHSDDIASSGGAATRRLRVKLFMGYIMDALKGYDLLSGIARPTGPAATAVGTATGTAEVALPVAPPSKH